MNNTPKTNTTRKPVATHLPPTNQINITAINVNSLIHIAKRVELEYFIHNESIDIALISKTKFKPSHKPKIIRTDRPGGQKGGGTAIIIKKEILYEKVHISSNKEIPTIDHTIIKINLP